MEILPTDPKDWHHAVRKRGLTGKTVHSAVLASASQFEYDQFLLLRVLWTDRKMKELNSALGLSEAEINQAASLLREIKSWSTYHGSFASRSGIPEGTFAIARYYQLEVTRTQEEADPTSFYTPIVNRTRSRTQRSVANQMADLQLQTPTRNRANEPPMTPKASRFDVRDKDDSDESEPSPFQPVSPISPASANVLYPPTKDEQIVNTALIVFLNALTMHCRLSSSWTLHRKSFTAIFQGAQFEARIDGYLQDHRGNPRALVEVKPILRSRKLAAI